MKEEEMKIKAGKPYEELTTEEKALIVDFTEEEHTELKLKYGKRLKHVTVQAVSYTHLTLPTTSRV